MQRLGVLAVLLLSGLLLNQGDTQADAPENSSRHFGLTERVPWTTSRVVGTPDPPPPFRGQRAYPNLKFEGPSYIVEEPGTDRLMVAQYDGKIYAFPKHRADVGMAARNDVLNVQVERDEAELSRLQAANSAAVANENLVRLLGLAPGSRVEPSEPLAGSAGPDEPLEALVAAALETRPEIAGLRARAAAAEAAVRVTQSATRPQASLDAGFDYARPNLRILPLTDTWNDSWRVGVNVSLRAFDGGRTSAAVAQARCRRSLPPTRRHDRHLRRPPRSPPRRSGHRYASPS